MVIFHSNWRVRFAIMGVIVCSGTGLLTACDGTVTISPIGTGSPAVSSSAPIAPESTVAVPTSGVGLPRAWISPSVDTIRRGSTLHLAATVDPGTIGMSSGDITVLFNPDAFEVVAIKPGSLLGSDPLVGSQHIDNSAGSVELALARVGQSVAPSPQGIFADVTLLVRQSAPAGDQAFSVQISLADQQFKSVKVETLGAKVSIIAP